ncbi:hypothetical protein OSTOST_02080 [Ostertagia ostertagi]
MVIRIDEVDQEVRNARSDIQKISYQTLLLELRQRDHQFDEFKDEVISKLNAMEQKIEILPEILSTLKAIQDRMGREASPEKLKDEDFFKIEDSPEYEPQFTAPSQVAADVNPKDDKSIREAIRANQKELTKVEHAIFSIRHKIEEEQKTSVASPERRTKIDALKREKYKLIDEEMKLKQKVRDLKLMLAEWTKALPRSSRGSPRRSRMGTPPRSSRGSPRRSRMSTPSRSSRGSPRRSRMSTPPRSSRGSPRRSRTDTTRRSSNESPRRSRKETPRQSSHGSPPKHN